MADSESSLILQVDRVGVGWLGDRWLKSAWSADYAAVVARWCALVLERVRPGNRCSLPGGRSPTWNFSVLGRVGEGGGMDGGAITSGGGGAIGGTSVITGVITGGTAGSTGGTDSAGGTGGAGGAGDSTRTKRVLTSMSDAGSCTSAACPAQPR